MNVVPLDFTEISVTRRVFRSGDSEYLLNKQTCQIEGYYGFVYGFGAWKRSFFDYFTRSCR